MLWMLVAVAEAKNPTCRVPEGDALVGRTSVSLVNGIEAASQEARRAALEQRAPRPTPTNGLLLVRVDRTDAALAENWNHVVVVEDRAGAPIRFTSLPGDGPTDPTPLSEHWTNVLVVPLPDTVRFPTRVHAIDQTAEHECAWSVDSRGRAVPL